MAIPDNYIDKITKDGESRMISPAADKVRVDSEHYEGDNLDDVLDEIAEAIDEAGSGDGTVKGVKVGSTTYDPDSETGVVDLSTPIAGKVDKVPGKGLSTNDYTDADKAAVETISSKANADEVAGKLSQSDISVETQGDGTVKINVGSGANKDTYTINLNHTHENMAKLIVCEESDLPSTLDEYTIYGVEADGEISVIYLCGTPFYGGGSGNTPVLRRPIDGTTIRMGDVSNGSVSKTINVKGKSLSQDLTIEVSGTGYTFDTSILPTGASVVQGSTTELIIDAAAANTLAGVDIVVVYTGSSDNAGATLSISSASPDLISVEVSLIANAVDTDGLIGYWDATDAPVSGAWVDKVNGMKLNLGGTAAKTSDGYQLNNLSAQKAAWMTLDTNDTSLLNTEIDEEFTCIVDCLVKFSSADKNVSVIDFGSGAQSASNVSLRPIINQGGILSIRAKSNGNHLLTPYQDDQQIQSFALDTYVPVRVVCGTYVNTYGQLPFAEIDNAKVYSIIQTPLTINFSGCTNSQGVPVAPYAFVLGLGYIADNSEASEYYPSYLSDVVYKRILLYNKKK